MSVCPSFRMEQLGSHWIDFHEIWYLRVFRKYVGIFQVTLKSDKNNRNITWRPIYSFDLYRSVLLKLRNVSDKTCRENQNTHFVFSDCVSPENRAICEVRTLDTQGYKHTLTICNAFSFSMLSFNRSACGHLNPSSYCDVGRLFYGVFKLWTKSQRKKLRNNF